jgi:hypothetical protein
VAADQKRARARSAWLVFDESGVWLIPGAAHLVAALGYQPDGTKARLCFHLQQDAYDTDSLIGVLEQLKAFYAGQQMVLGYRRLGISTSSCRCAAAIHPERMM